MARRHNGEGSWEQKQSKVLPINIFETLRANIFTAKQILKLTLKEENGKKPRNNILHPPLKTSAARLLAIMFFPGFWIKKNWKSNGIQPMAMRPA